jgi:CRISPR-associated endonuclease/helicase Cas3
MTIIRFDTAFPALTGHQPLSWQWRLFDQLCSGRIPRSCNLPTGLGKTSVIPIWTIALAQQVQDSSVALPRRLVYVVNRRTVVDQATSVVEQICERLLSPDDPRWPAHKEALRSLAGTLRSLASTKELLLAVSTLRGELADNEEWKADPARPAIIIGTIDMIGSKLLFSGYGDGPYWRAQHAGLVGQDSFIVHDEAHLTPAFSDLLRQLADVQRQAGEPKQVRVMELSATSRGGEDPFLRLEPEDENDEVVRERLDATKRLHLHGVEASPQEKRANIVKKTLEKLLELSLSHRDEQAKVLVYTRSPEDAQEVYRLLKSRLEKPAEGHTTLLTGTIRGYEREKLVREDPVYKAFLDPDVHISRTMYLVSTSAGEVGIDIDADHMVCDLTTLDSMIQRLGRVNRRGGPDGRPGWTW